MFTCCGVQQTPECLVRTANHHLSLATSVFRKSTHSGILTNGFGMKFLQNSFKTIEAGEEDH